MNKSKFFFNLSILIAKTPDLRHLFDITKKVKVIIWKNTNDQNNTFDHKIIESAAIIDNLNHELNRNSKNF
jgi:hypothetical protein